MVLQKVWVWVCLRNYIKIIRKRSESKWSIKKRTGRKARKYMGKMRIGWEKVQENVGQTIQMTHFLAIFLPFRFLPEKQHRSVKNCPNFSKINFFTFFAKILLVFLPFFPISSNFLSHVLIFLFAVRFRYAQSTHWGTLIRPPYPPSTVTRIRSFLCSPFLFFQSTY